MNYTYTITADNGINPKIVFSYSGLNILQARAAYNSLKLAFRTVDVVNDITGEVMISLYRSDEFFEPAFSETEAIENTRAALELLNH